MGSLQGCPGLCQVVHVAVCLYRETLAMERVWKGLREGRELHSKSHTVCAALVRRWQARGNKAWRQALGWHWMAAYGCGGDRRVVAKRAEI